MTTSFHLQQIQLPNTLHLNISQHIFLLFVDFTGMHYLLFFHNRNCKSVKIIGREYGVSNRGRGQTVKHYFFFTSTLAEFTI